MFVFVYTCSVLDSIKQKNAKLTLPMKSIIYLFKYEITYTKHLIQTHEYFLIIYDANIIFIKYTWKYLLMLEQKKANVEKRIFTSIAYLRLNRNIAKCRKHQLHQSITLWIQIYAIASFETH